MTKKTHDHADVLAPPPLIYGGALLAGLALQWLDPIVLLSRTVARAFGLLLIGFSFLISIPALRTMQRAQTSVRPDTPTTAIVTTGPFRYTRNPLYLSFTLLYAGITLVVNAFWPFLLLPLVLVVMNRGVIAREEHYLTQKFGKVYTQYKAQVGRWF